MLPFRLLALACVALGVAGCGFGRIVDDIAASQGDIATYTIHDVTLFAPDGTNTGAHGPGTYTLRWRFLLQSGPNPGGPPNGIRPMVALIDDDDWFNGEDDMIAAEQHVPVNMLVSDPLPSSNFDEAMFVLNCVDGAVEGNFAGHGGSGESTAEIFGRVERTDGTGAVDSWNTLTVECP